MENVIIFGIGDYYQKKKKTIFAKWNVVGYVDNKDKLCESYKFEESSVYNPANICQMDSNAKVLIMSGKYYEMYEQLKILGISDDKILFGINLLPAYDAIEKMVHNRNIVMQAKNNRIYVVVDDEEVTFDSEFGQKKWIRRMMMESNSVAQSIQTMPLEPVSRRFGAEFGTPIDRVYIRDFIEKNKRDITGDIIEIGDLRYSKEFAHDVNKMQVLHVDGVGDNAIKGNLETGEGIVEDSVDCLICTQTIQHIKNPDKVIANIYKLLKPNGVALISNGFLTEISSYSYRNWGEYWRFSDQGIRSMLQKRFADDRIAVIPYGNVKTALAIQYGVCAEILSKEDFEFNDVQYQVTVCARVQK